MEKSNSIAEANGERLMEMEGGGEQARPPLSSKDKMVQVNSGVTTGGSGGSCLRAPARRGRLAASIETK